MLKVQNVCDACNGAYLGGFVLTQVTTKLIDNFEITGSVSISIELADLLIC